jgi:hypothetical protein
LKASYVLKPGKFTIVDGSYVVFHCDIPAPKEMPRDLPALPPGHMYHWLILIGMRQWRKVAHMFRGEHNDQLIVEGAPVDLTRQLCLCAPSVKSVFLEKQRQESHGPHHAPRWGAESLPCWDTSSPALVCLDSGSYIIFLYNLKISPIPLGICLKPLYHLSSYLIDGI